MLTWLAQLVVTYGYGAAVPAHPWVLALRRRVAPQLAFLQARLSLEGYLVLHLRVDWC